MELDWRWSGTGFRCAILLGVERVPAWGRFWSQSSWGVSKSDDVDVFGVPFS